jgi:hypothetical protein
MHGIAWHALLCMTLHCMAWMHAQVVAFFTEKVWYALSVIHLTAQFGVATDAGSVSDSQAPFGVWREEDLEVLSVKAVFQAIQMTPVLQNSPAEINKMLHDTIWGGKFFQSKLPQLLRVCMCGSSGQGCKCSGCWSALSAVMPIRAAEPGWVHAASIGGEDPGAGLSQEDCDGMKRIWEGHWQTAINTLLEASGRSFFKGLAHEGLWKPAKGLSEADKLLRNFVALNEPNKDR